MHGNDILGIRSTSFNWTIAINIIVTLFCLVAKWRRRRGELETIAKQVLASVIIILEYGHFKTATIIVKLLNLP